MNPGNPVSCPSPAWGVARARAVSRTGFPGCDRTHALSRCGRTTSPPGGVVDGRPLVHLGIGTLRRPQTTAVWAPTHEVDAVSPPGHRASASTRKIIRWELPAPADRSWRPTVVGTPGSPRRAGLQHAHSLICVPCGSASVYSVASRSTSTIARCRSGAGTADQRRRSSSCSPWPSAAGSIANRWSTRCGPIPRWRARCRGCTRRPTSCARRRACRTASCWATGSSSCSRTQPSPSTSSTSNGSPPTPSVRTTR